MSQDKQDGIVIDDESHDVVIASEQALGEHTTTEPDKDSNHEEIGVIEPQVNQIQNQTDQCCVEKTEEQEFPALKCHEHRWCQPGRAKFFGMMAYVFCVCAVNQFDESVLPLALPQIQTDLKIDYQTSQWLETAYYLGCAATTISLAKLAAMRGNLILTYVLLILVFVLYVVAFFVRDFISLCIIRALIGALTSGFLTTRNVFISAYPSASDKVKSVADTLILRIIQQIIMPIAGGYIIQYGGWKYVHLVPAIFAAASILLLIPFGENIKQTQSLKLFDIVGSLVLMLLLSALEIMLIFLSMKQWIVAGVAFGVLIICCVGFYYTEKRAKSPILPLYLLRNPLVDVLYINTMNFANTLAIQFLIPQLLKHYGFDPSIIGFITAGGSCCGVISTFINNAVTKRVVTRIVLPAVYTSMIVVQIIYTVTCGTKWGCLVMFLIYLFFSIWLQQHTYASLLTCAPKSLQQYVCGFPPLSRTFGSSIAGCINQIVFAVIQEITHTSSKNDVLITSTTTIIIVLIIIQFCSMFISAFCLGNFAGESSKKYYKESKVRHLKGYVESEA